MLGEVGGFVGEGEEEGGAEAVRVVAGLVVFYGVVLKFGQVVCDVLNHEEEKFHLVDRWGGAVDDLFDSEVGDPVHEGCETEGAEDFDEDFSFGVAEDGVGDAGEADEGGGAEEAFVHLFVAVGEDGLFDGEAEVGEEV